MNKKVTLEKGKKGFWTLKYNNQALHSSFDPYKEAKRMLPDNIDSNLFIVFGLGLGYHVQVLLEKIKDKNCRIFVFEADSEIINAFYEINLFEDDRVFIYNIDQFDSFCNFFTKTISFHELEQPVFLELNSEKNLFLEEFNSLRSKINTFLNYYFQSLFTEAEFGHLWLQNIIINSTHLFQSHFSLYLENDAVLVSAGPSLRESIPDLKRFYKRLPFFVVDTALDPLLDAGIIPDVIIATDPQIHNYYDFFHLQKNSDIILACDISTYYKIPELFKNKVFFRTQGLGEAFFKVLNNRSSQSLKSFPPGGSVSASALTFMQSLGAKRILMAGQDLCYPNLTHSVGTLHYNRFLLSSNRKKTIWNLFQSIINSRGRQDLFLKNLSKWIDDFINLSKIEVFQLNPVHPLKNASGSIPADLNGKLFHFKKLPRFNDNSIKEFFDTFLEQLHNLRSANDIDVFSKIRKENIELKPIFDKLFLKQDLYLNRKNGDPALFLGGCYRIIDRLIRAFKYKESYQNRKN